MALLISEKLWSFTEAAENAASIDELSTRFQNLLAPHGVTGSSIAVISKPERVITDGFGLLDMEWTTIYMERNYLADDPVFRSLRLRNTEGLWAKHLDGLPITPEGDRVMSDARDFNIKDGFTRFLGSSRGGRFMLCLQGEKIDTDPQASRLFNMAGQVFLEEGLRLLSEPTEFDNDAPITQQQLNVLLLLMEGDSQKVIARKLSISPRTVEVHVKDIKQRLGARNGWEAVRIAIERGVFQNLGKTG